jgi:hypothetical protein
MARPKGAKDKRPRKPRLDSLKNAVKDRGKTLHEGKPNPEAPYGYSVHGEPLASPPKPPKSEAGRIKLQKSLEARGLVQKRAGALGGRPESPIDPEQVKSMAAIGCTLDEMSTVLKCSVDLLERRFKDLIAEHRDKGRMSLRRLQLRIAQGHAAEYQQDPETKVPVLVRPAMPPNAQMAIHLGKHWLGQKDAPAQNNILVANGAKAQGIPSEMSPETEARLAALFLEICPEAAQEAVSLDKSMEVMVA